MATVFESISLKGLRRADIRQLHSILHQHIETGKYWGNQKQHYERNSRLLKWISSVEEYAYKNHVRMPKER